MKFAILLKLEYLLENFESINSFTVITKINREFDSNYLVIIHMNSKILY